MSEQAIDKLNERQVLVAYMAAAGRTTRDIAAQTGYSTEYVTALKRDPLVRTLIEKLQRDVKDSTLSSFNHMLEQEMIPTLQRVRELRDQVKDQSVALGASKLLFDYGLPKRQAEEVKPSIVVQIDARTLNLMKETVGHLKQVEADDGPH